MERIEEEVEAHNQQVYGGAMTAHSKNVLREMIRKEDRFWEKEGRDFINGYDDGEAERITSYEE